jgi:hypothetical protein
LAVHVKAILVVDGLAGVAQVGVEGQQLAGWASDDKARLPQPPQRNSMWWRLMTPERCYRQFAHIDLPF